MKTVKKIISSLLISAFVLSAASCNKAKPEDIAATADTYAKCVQYLDADRILENTEPVDEAQAEAFRKKLTLTDDDYDQADLKSIIGQTIQYTVNNDSINIEAKTASLDVTFTRIKYESAFNNLVGLKDAHLKALNECKETLSTTINITLNKQEDGRWLASSDTLAKLDELYSFLDAKFEFNPDTPDLFDSTSWLFGKDGNYENTKCIELDIWFKYDPEEEFYYVVSQNNAELYKSEPEKTTDIFFRAKYDKSLGAKTTSTGYINQGIYNIKIYRKDGLLMANETTTVIVNGAKGSPEITSAPKGASYTINDPSFASIKSLGWWDYAGTLLSDGIYCINTKTLAFSIELLSDADSVYYAYYFVPGENASTKNIDYTKPVYSNSLEQFIYIDGTTFFNFDYEPAKMEVGTYVLIICKDAMNIDKPYVTATCKIIPQSSEEFI